jgi:hypothetical protein
VDLEAEAPGDGAQWELTLRPRNFTSNESYRIRAAATADHTPLVFNLANPQLWWTWDHGKPNLYTLDVRLLDPAGAPVDGKTLAVGIREIESIGWNFYLNRKRFFVRGTNYYYNLFLSEMDRAANEREFQAHARHERERHPYPLPFHQPRVLRFGPMKTACSSGRTSWKHGIRTIASFPCAPPSFMTRTYAMCATILPSWPGPPATRRIWKTTAT